MPMLDGEPPSALFFLLTEISPGNEGTRWFQEWGELDLSSGVTAQSCSLLQSWSTVCETWESTREVLAGLLTQPLVCQQMSPTQHVQRGTSNRPHHPPKPAAPTAFLSAVWQPHPSRWMHQNLGVNLDSSLSHWNNPSGRPTDSLPPVLLPTWATNMDCQELQCYLAGLAAATSASVYSQQSNSSSSNTLKRKLDCVTPPSQSLHWLPFHSEWELKSSMACLPPTSRALPVILPWLPLFLPLPPLCFPQKFRHLTIKINK